MKKTRKKSAQAGYETRDVAARKLVYSGIGLLLGTAACGLLVAGLLAVLPAPDHPAKPPLESVSLEPPPPRLEIDGRSDRAAIEAAARAKLEGYGWVDRGAGIARIPIERAMALLAAEGWGRP
jgi:hypothetical protein